MGVAQMTALKGMFVAYAALGIATVCRTGMMVESLGGFVGLHSDTGAMRVMPPSGHHPGQHHATDRAPVAEPAGARPEDQH